MLRALLVVLTLSAELAFADGAGPWLSFDVHASQKTRAVLYLEDGNVVGSGPDGRAQKVDVRGFERLVIDGRSWTFTFPKGRAPVVLRDVAINGQLLLKDASLCREDAPLIFELRRGSTDVCPEIRVRPEDQSGDWDACAIGYQPSNRRLCRARIPGVEVYWARVKPPALE